MLKDTGQDCFCKSVESRGTVVPHLTSPSSFCLKVRYAWIHSIKHISITKVKLCLSREKHLCFPQQQFFFTKQFQKSGGFNFKFQLIRSPGRRWCFGGSGSLIIDTHRDVTAGICCFIVTLNPTMTCDSCRCLIQAYLASTLRTTLDA